MNYEIENKFFIEFQYDGAAILALKMVNYKYCGVGSEVPARNDYPDGVLAEIKMRTENCEVWPWSDHRNKCSLLEEITDNIRSCASKEEMIIYAEDILLKFQSWTLLYSLFPHKLEAIGNTVVRNTPEAYFRKWYVAFVSFAQKFAVVLAKREINILDIQKQCGVRIIDRLDIDELWMSFGTRKSAEVYLSRLNGAQDNSFQFPEGLETEKAKRYFAAAIAEGLIEITNGSLIWKGDSKVLLDLFCGVVYCNDEIISNRNGAVWCLGKGEILNVKSLSSLFNEKHLGQQRLNNLYDDRKRNAPRGWRTIVDLQKKCEQS